MTVAEITEIEFVNRTDELQFLLDLLPPKSHESSLVVVRSPTGFGKSRLTTELIRKIAPHVATGITVDPLIRSRPGAALVREGFFVQQCALEMARYADAAQREIGSLKRFLSERRWHTVKRKNPLTELRQLPGLRVGYSLAVEYIERFFARGRHAPAQILTSEATEAIETCNDYLEYVCGLGASILVVREVQHIDHESLRSLMQLNRKSRNQHLVLEYTTPSGKFDDDHQKVLQRELRGHTNAHLLDLVQLDRQHLEEMLRRMPGDDISLSSDFFGRWDGNLRVLTDLKYVVGVGRRLSSSADSVRDTSDLASLIGRELDLMTPSQRLLLAVAIAHGEPIHQRTLFSVIQAQSPHATESGLRDDFETLTTNRRFLDFSDDQVVVRHETVEIAVKAAQPFIGLLALADKALREHYAAAIERKDFTITSMATAIRRLFVFCARTRDVQSLIRITSDLDAQIRNAHDQTLYVDVVRDVVAKLPDLLPDERAKLIHWGAGLAYELNDFANTIGLIEQLPIRRRLESALLAFAFTERGQHAQAKAIAAAFRAEQIGSLALVADTIDAGLALDEGRWNDCRKLLERVIDLGEQENSPLVGHAFRLLAEIQDYPECTDSALKSVSWFDRLGLKKCAAYSALSAGRFLARTGQTSEAIQLVERASETLRGTICNKHILLNNRALVGLLADAPDYAACSQWLREALRSSRDEFADLTILTNLAISSWKEGKLETALECVERCMPILDDPEFVERDVYWLVCFNLGQVLDAAGEKDRAAAIRVRPGKIGRMERGNDSYWRYRYGESAAPNGALGYLLRFDYHPGALSHWQIDLEALDELNLESR